MRGQFIKRGTSPNPISTTPLFRVASPYHRMATTGVVAGANGLRCAGRYRRDIGSADKKSLYVVLSNFALKSNGTVDGYGNSKQVVGCYVEANGVSRQVSWGGNPTPAVPSGTNKLVSDALLPSQFGLVSFTQNSVPRIRLEESIPAGGSIPVLENSEFGGEAFTYDPTATTLNNLSSTGSLAFTGSTTASFGTSVVLLGEDVTGDARTWLGAADSIGNNGAGASYIINALIANPANLISGIIVGRVGGQSDVQTNYASILGIYAEWTNGVIEEYGTNTVNNSNLATCQALALASWAFWRSRQSTHPLAQPMVIVRPNLLVKDYAQISAVNISNGGTGYANSFAVTFTTVGSLGIVIAATGTATAVGGVIQSVTMGNLGGYTQTPTPNFSAGGGSGAVATSVWGFNNLTNQVPFTAAWDAGGTVEQLNTWFATQVGVVGGVDYCVDILSGVATVRGSLSGQGTPGSDWYKWDVSVTRTGDGLHPNSAGANGTTGIGANLKVALLRY